MELKINRDALLKPLQLVSGVVERRQTLPILGNVLLKSVGDQLSITATDLEIEMVTQVPLMSGSEGETTVPARKFIDICRALPEGANIIFALEDERAVLRCGKSRFVLATLSPTEFPNIDSFDASLTFDVAQGQFKRLIDQTQFAMAQQDVRYYLNGLLLEFYADKIRAVATDGHRLALCDIEAQTSAREVQQIILPRKAVAELGKLLDGADQPVTVRVGSNHIQFTTAQVSFISKLIDGRFPDYQRVVPMGGDKIVLADRDTLRGALSRASILSNEKYRSVRLTLGSASLRVLAHNPEQEEAEEEIAVDYDGPALEIGFNASYVMDALAAVPAGDVRLELTDQNSCCLIRQPESEACKYVVMPMRL